MRRLVLVAAPAALLAAACSSGATAPTVTTTPPTTIPAESTTTTTTTMDTRLPVILDYSPTVSDIGAIAFVASHPDIRLIAVTLPGRGESFCKQGVAHTRGVLIALGLPEVPVACSESDLPLEGFNSFPVFWRQGANAMDLPEGEPNESRFAAELIVDMVIQTEAPVEILAVGPLTNLAVAFESDPSLIDRLRGVTIMGGAVDVAGNVFANDVAEWNIWVDPAAAARVFASGVPLTVVPLDATNYLPANRTFFESLDAQASTPAARLVRDVIEADSFWLSGEGFFFWDELAAAVLVDESLVTFETRNLVVDVDPDERAGGTREDPEGVPVRVATAADRGAFERLFLETLVGGPADLGYLDATAEEIAYFDDVEGIVETFDAQFGALIEKAAAGLELTESSAEDEDFLTVLQAALPVILAGPWVDQITALDSVAVPESLTEPHEAWVEALRAFGSSEEQLLAALDDGFEAFEPFLGPVGAACLGIQTEAAIRLLEFSLACSDWDNPGGDSP